MLPPIHGRFLANYLLNFLSAISLIYISKWILQHYQISSLSFSALNCLLTGFFASITLTCLQKPTTNILPSFRQYKNLFRLLLISASFSAFLTFSNLSLQYNTIGTYQLIKLQVPLTLMLIEWIQLQTGINSSRLSREKFLKDYSLSVQLAFGIIVLGTLINTYSDLYFHPFGATCALISVLCNGLYQTLVQSYSASSAYERMRFLQIQCTTSGIMLLPLWIFMDSFVNVQSYMTFGWNILFGILFCGLVAFVVNLSVIWCIKDDAAIGFNMVGQLKTLCIVFIGSALFHEVLTIKQIISILFTTLGCLYYVYITYRTKESQKHKQTSLISNNNI